jgi:hypothetical protein
MLFDIKNDLSSATKSYARFCILFIKITTILKLYGEGEWKVRKHGADKRRTWLKLHLGINEANHDIEAVVLTGNDVHDSETL